MNISFGDLILGSFKDQLCLCDWRYRKMRSSIDKRIQKGLDAHYIEEESSVIRATRAQLSEYLNADRKVFDIPIQMVGTEFQKSVWNELLNIPFGKTESYQGLSEKLSSRKAIRAVATANGANAISILIPCHRVIGTKGELVGYAGGLNVKSKLLELEKNEKVPEQMQLFE